MVIPMLNEVVFRPLGVALALPVLLIALFVVEAYRTRRGHRSVFAIMSDIEDSELY